jgi:hypothetical protein
VRGERVSKETRGLDLVLESVRYQPDGERLQFARGYARRGFVWGDLVLLSREELLHHLRAKKRVVTGRPAGIEGNFEVYATVRLAGKNGNEVLLAGESEGQRDDLGLPIV